MPPKRKAAAPSDPLLSDQVKKKKLSKRERLCQVDAPPPGISEQQVDDKQLRKDRSTQQRACVLKIVNGLNKLKYSIPLPLMTANSLYNPTAVWITWARLDPVKPINRSDKELSIIDSSSTSSLVEKRYLYINGGWIINRHEPHWFKLTSGCVDKTPFILLGGLLACYNLHLFLHAVLRDIQVVELVYDYFLTEFVLPV